MGTISAEDQDTLDYIIENRSEDKLSEERIAIMNQRIADRGHRLAEKPEDDINQPRIAA